MVSSHYHVITRGGFIVISCQDVFFIDRLIFSQSLLSLDLIEDFLEFWDGMIRSKAAEDNDGVAPDNINGWIHGLDYFRMDGSTSAMQRKRWSEIFNDEDNLR